MSLVVSFFLFLGLVVYDDQGEFKEGQEAGVTESGGQLQLTIDNNPALPDANELQIFESIGEQPTLPPVPGPVAAPQPGPLPAPHQGGGDCPSSGFTLVKDILLLPGRTYHTAESEHVYSLEFTQATIEKLNLQFGNVLRRPLRVTITDCPGDLDLVANRLQPACIRNAANGSFTLRFDDPFKQQQRTWVCDLIPDGRKYYINFAYFEPLRMRPTCGVDETCTFFTED